MNILKTSSSSTPLISVGIPVYNGSNYLRAAIESLLAQTYKDFEIVISDNASTDETERICEDFMTADSRVRYSRSPMNVGASGNFRRVFELSRGTFFKWAGHDDLHHPTLLERCVDVFDRNGSDVVLVAPRTEIIDAKGVPMKDEYVERTVADSDMRHRRVFQVLHNAFRCTAQFGLFRSEALSKTRLIDSFYASDRVLFMEIAMLGKVLEVPEILFQNRVHGQKCTEACKTAADWYKFYSGVVTTGRKDIGIEYLRSAIRMKVPLAEKLRCIASCYHADRKYLLGHYGNKTRIRTRLKAFWYGRRRSKT